MIKSGMRFRFLFFFFMVFSGVVFAQNALHWKSLVQTGDSCRYFIPNTDIGDQWKSHSFNDSDWIAAIGGVGSADGDDSTVIEPVHSVYMRYQFSIEDTASIQNVILDVDYDDGFIAYLNGIEVARANIEDPVTWDMKMWVDNEPRFRQKDIAERFGLKGFPFIQGINTLALEVHNFTDETQEQEPKDSLTSDITSNVFIHLGLANNTNFYRDQKEWFSPPIIDETFNLPLMVIDTRGLNIPNEPRIKAQMKLIDYDGTNTVDLQPNEYSGQISIEIRGESSSLFEKKSFSIELQNPDGSNNNVSMLGLPKENDFVLYGVFADRTLVKNVLTYQLFRELGGWASRTRFIELIINGDYKGIYILEEKIKRDKNRVDINKLTEEDVSDIDISGGFIMRKDKTNRLNDNEYWTSEADQIFHARMKYQYFYPNVNDLTHSQQQYIKDWLYDFDQIMSSENYDDPELGYAPLVNPESFINMLFVNEFSKSADCYMFSTYFYKEHDEEGGRLCAGPPWDFNLTYGNIDYGYENLIPYTYGFIYPMNSRTYWWARMMQDPKFENQVFKRWDEVSKTIFNTEHVGAIIDSCINLLGPAVDRNFERFQILGNYVWPNVYNPPTYEEEIDFVKNWIEGRLEWLSLEWGGKYKERLAFKNHQIPGVIEAEDFDYGPNGMVYHDNSSTNLGLEYRDSDEVDIESTTDRYGRYNIYSMEAGEWLEYTIDTVIAGAYDIDFRISSQTNVPQSLKIILDGQVIGAVDVPNTGDENSWETIRLPDVVLQGGANQVLQILIDQGGFKLNNIKFFHTRTPYAIHTLPGRIELEEYDYGGEGIAYHDNDDVNQGKKLRDDGVDINNTKDTGGGHQVQNVAKGEWLEYSIKDIKGGVYRIDFRVTTKRTGAKIKLSLDGEKIGEVEVPNTGGFNNWETVSLQNIELDKGENKILRIEFTNAMNVNFIDFDQLTNIRTFDLATLYVYPNPAHEVLQVGGVGNIETCSVYNLMGRKMEKCQVVGNRIDISNLSQGIYMLAIDGYTRKKFIKIE